QHHRRKGGIVGRRRLFGPGHHLTGVMLERAKHLLKQRRCFGTLVGRTKREPDCLQPDVGAATFVGDWKTISAEAKFVATEQADADRAGPGDNDGAVLTTMCAETGSQSVADEAKGRERMRNLLESRLGALARETGKSDPRVHEREILAC